MKQVLITGAQGFLGRYCAQEFATHGWRVVGLDIVEWQDGQPQDYGIDEWHTAAVTLPSLAAVTALPDAIIHCAGSGSVGFSLQHPYDDFCMTVNTTATVLEYLRTSAPKARLIYPSSAAVYGCRHSGPLKETFQPDPVSPYGVHKLMAEQLCLSAVRNFGLDCRIVRFFSLYGLGLRKQLLWDAARRLAETNDETVEFSGNGQETRDWLHVRDAASLILAMAENDSTPLIVNGASGEVRSVREILLALRDVLGSRAKIAFNNQVREGDPQHLQAEISLSERLEWRAKGALGEGLKEYAVWFKNVTK